MAAFPVGSELQTFLISTGILDNPPVAPMTSIEFDNKMLAVKQHFEDWTGFHPFEAAAASTRYFNPWDIRDGELDLKGGLVALSSLTISGTLQVLDTDFWLEPDNAAAVGRPYTRIAFTNGPGAVSSYASTGTRRSVVVVGTWGYCAASGVPAQVRDGCLAAGAVLCAPQLALNISGGRTALTADDVKLQFVHSVGSSSSSGGPLSGEAAEWRKIFKGLHPYRRLVF